MSPTFYAKALSRWPGNTLALFGTGNIHYAQGNRKAAEATYQRLLAIRPDHVAARNNLAHLLAEHGCREAAIAELDSGLADMSNNDPMRQHLIDTRTEILNSSVAASESDVTCQTVMPVPRSSIAAPAQVGHTEARDRAR